MDNVQNRKFVIVAIFIFFGLVLIIRLLFVQLISDEHKDWAQTVSTRSVRVKPDRGLLFDRYGKIMVGNQKSFDVNVIPSKFRDYDTIATAKTLGLTVAEFVDVLTPEDPKDSYYTVVGQTLLTGVKPTEISSLKQKLYDYKCFQFKESSSRTYPTPIAAHVLGYIGRIFKEDLDKDTLDYYTQNDLIGRTGLESTYENELRGIVGFKNVLRDNKGKIKEVLKYDTASAGSNLYTTLDLELQAYGELLMGNKIGSIVAIEPSTGEILSMVSAPTFDPNLLSGKDYSKNYAELAKNDSLKPMLNKAIYNDSYRPGSIFKLIQALVAMESGAIDSTSGFTCNKGLIGCHNHPHPANIEIAIQHSCNPYFYQVYKKMIQRGKTGSVFTDSRLGLTDWREQVQSFGLGTRIRSDIPMIKPGVLPDTTFYDKWYGKNRWAFSTIYSNSIGEGEIGVAPIQMANLAAIIANRGWYYTPHFVKKIGEDGTKRDLYLEKNYTSVRKEFYIPVVNAMEQVVSNGTARRAQIDSISVCGKTGTVENKSFNDHSVFIAFAPKDNPKIAIAVYVEYGTWGGTWAAPIASLMIEKYLRREIRSKAGLAKEKKALETEILWKHAKW